MVTQRALAVRAFGVAVRWPLWATGAAGAPKAECSRAQTVTIKPAGDARAPPRYDASIRRSERAGVGTARHEGHGQQAAWTGSVKRKVVPSPSLLSAQIRPPWPCTMHLEMKSPKPKPLRSFFLT